MPVMVNRLVLGVGAVSPLSMEGRSPSADNGSETVNTTVSEGLGLWTLPTFGS